MSSRHSRASYSSDDDFFESGARPKRTETRVISERYENSDLNDDDYSGDDFDGSSENSRSASRSTSISKQSFTSASKSAHSTSTLVSSKRQSNDFRSFTELHSSVKKSCNVYGNIRKKTASSRAKAVPKYDSPPPKKSPVIQLMLSSKQQELNNLLNKLSSTKQTLASAEKENKVLKKLQKRQDKAICKFETTRNELPQYLSKNSEDQRTLKMELRRTQDTKRSLESKLHQNFEEMQKMEGVLTRLKKLVYDKGLGERSELSKQLADTESDLEKAQQRISELDKKIASKVSSYSKQLKTERQRHRNTMHKLQKMEIDYLQTNSTLKERERALQKGNIYSFRNREINDQVLLPITASTPKLPLPAIPHSGSPRNGFREDHNKKNSEFAPKSETPTTTSVFQKSRTKPAKVFLTADFDSPASSRNNSFITNDDAKQKELKIQEQEKIDKEDQFAKDLQKTEEEIKALRASVEQKSSILAKLQEIDRTTPRNPEILKSGFEQDIFNRNAIDKSQSSNNTGPSHSSTEKYATNRFRGNEDDIFGEYAPSIHTTSQRKSSSMKKKAAVLPHDESDLDEPLFDLSSGKNNKKPDLLTQLFGNQSDTKNTRVVH